MVMKKRACLLCVVIAWSVYLFLLPNFESLGALTWSQNLPPNLTPQNEVALEQGVWPPVEPLEQSSDNVIPHNIFFTYKTDLIGSTSAIKQDNNELNLIESIFRENVLHTTNLYRAAWRSSKQSEGSVYFLDDDKCRDIIHKTEPLLVAHFNDEKKGMYKADTCRVAALFAHGGYYFDSDLLAICFCSFVLGYRYNNPTRLFSLQ